MISMGISSSTSHTVRVRLISFNTKVFYFMYSNEELFYILIYYGALISKVILMTIRMYI